MKRILKSIVAKVFFSRNNVVVIASTGRAGSTLLWRAVLDGYIVHCFNVDPGGFFGRTIARVVRSYCNRLADIDKSGGLVIKTHSLWDSDFNSARDVRFIFVHGDPLDSAYSAAHIVEKEGMSWLLRHISHLEGSEADFDSLFQKDALNYERQITTWFEASCKAENILCVAYEDLWAAEEIISAHLGFRIKLPEFKARVTRKLKVDSINMQLFERLRQLRKRQFGVHREDVCGN